MDSFGNYMRNIRKKANLTQIEAASEIGVSRNAIQDWEKDAYIPEKEKILKLSRAYHEPEGNILHMLEICRQKDSATANWRDVARQYRYKAILMSGERTKNKIDFKIIKDVKRVLFENKSIDIFCIVSRDGDYKELVKFLRDNKKRVVILGPKGISKKLENESSEIRIVNK